MLDSGRQNGNRLMKKTNSQPSECFDKVHDICYESRTYAVHVKKKNDRKY